MQFSHLFTMVKNTWMHPKPQPVYSSRTFQSRSTLSSHIYYSRELRAILVNPSLRKWIWDFLTDRKQWVKINNTISITITTNSGAPKGCVSSQALFSVYTSDCRPVDSSISKDHLFKYADDKGLLGLITENNHQIYETEV